MNKERWTHTIGAFMFGFFMGYQFGWVGIIGSIGAICLFCERG